MHHFPFSRQHSLPPWPQLWAHDQNWTIIKLVTIRVDWQRRWHRTQSGPSDLSPKYIYSSPEISRERRNCTEEGRNESGGHLNVQIPDYGHPWCQLPSTLPTLSSILQWGQWTSCFHFSCHMREVSLLNKEFWLLQPPSHPHPCLSPVSTFQVSASCPQCNVIPELLFKPSSGQTQPPSVLFLLH